MQNKALILAAGASLLLVACTRTVDRPVPIQVPVAVATPCPTPKIGSAGDPPPLPIEDITDQTQVDIAVNTWKATVLILQGYVARLRTEVADTRSAITECTKER
jgi:hypothetical protein